MSGPIRLDLGAGSVSPEGFRPMGADHGSAVFPLAYPDGSVDVIRASHVLEHFPHAKVFDVVKDWVRALKPGGKLQIAVPDLEVIAKKYLDGEELPIQGYLMGGQIDANDFHKAAFDQEVLREVMSLAGLVLIRRWVSEIEDAAALPVSLNLEGTKPFMAKPRVRAVMSVPRLGFQDHFASVMEALLPFGIAFQKVTGANWGQCLTRGMESALEADANLDLLLTLDYDTIFRAQDLARLVQTMMCHPEVDALAPLQSGRGSTMPLFSLKSGETRVHTSTFAGDVTEASTAHFGLTLLRAAKLRELPHPWFHHVPGPDGRWGDGHIDDDIEFWHRWKRAGNTIYLANRVPVGHLELMIKWPGKDLAVIHQSVSEFHKSGPPPEAWR